MVATGGATTASFNVSSTILYLVLSVAPSPDTSIKSCPDVWSASVADKVPTVVFSGVSIRISLAERERLIAVGGGRPLWIGSVSANRSLHHCRLL